MSLLFLLPFLRPSHLLCPSWISCFVLPGVYLYAFETSCLCCWNSPVLSEPALLPGGSFATLLDLTPPFYIFYFFLTITMPDSKCRLSLTCFNELQICSFNFSHTEQMYVQALRNWYKGLFKHGQTHNTNVQWVRYNPWAFIDFLKSLSLCWYIV